MSLITHAGIFSQRDPHAEQDILAAEAAGAEWGLTPAGITHNKNAYNRMIRYIKANGAWHDNAFYRVFAGPTTLAGGHACGRGGSITNFNFVEGDHDRFVGDYGNGTTKYLGSGYANNSQNQNDFLLFAFLGAPYSVSDQSGVGVTILGSTPGNGRALIGKNIGPLFHFRGKSNTTREISGITEINEFFGIRRNSSTEVEWRIDDATNIVSDTSTANSSVSIRIFANSDPTWYALARIFAVAYLPYADWNIWRSALNTYKSSLV